jgi:hypothetical protein
MRHAQATAWRCYDCGCATTLERHHLVYGVGATTIDLCPRCHGARHGRYNQYGEGALVPYKVKEGDGEVLVGLMDSASGALFMSWKQIDRVIFERFLSTSALTQQVQNEIDILVDTLLKTSKHAMLHFDACAYVQGKDIRLYNFGTVIVPVLMEVLKKTFNSPAYPQYEALFRIALVQLGWVTKTLNAAFVNVALPQAAALAQATQTRITHALILVASGHDTAPGIYGALEWLNKFARSINPQLVHQALGVKARELFGPAEHTRWVMGDRAGRIEVSARTAEQWAAAFKPLDVQKLLAK